MKIAYTSIEDEIIIGDYARVGAMGLVEVLPGRDAKSIRNRAFHLGVRTRENTTDRYPWPKDELAPVWRSWTHSAERGAPMARAY